MKSFKPHNWNRGTLLSRGYTPLNVLAEKALPICKIRKVARDFDLPEQGVTSFRIAPGAEWHFFARPGFLPGDGFKSAPLLP